MPNPDQDAQEQYETLLKKLEAEAKGYPDLVLASAAWLLAAKGWARHFIATGGASPQTLNDTGAFFIRMILHQADLELQRPAGALLH